MYTVNNLYQGRIFVIVYSLSTTFHGFNLSLLVSARIQRNARAEQVVAIAIGSTSARTYPSAF